MQTTQPESDRTQLLKAPVLVLLLFMTCALFARSYTRINLEAGGFAPDIAKDLSWLLVPPVLGILMWPILRQNWQRLIALFQFRHLTVRLVLVSVALGAVLRLAFWGGLVGNAGFRLLVLPDPTAATGPIFSFSCPSHTALALSTLVMVLLTPLVEEVFDRGFILQTLLPKSRWLAVIVSSILFGIYHNPQIIGPATIFGVFLAIQFLNVQTLWAPLITHATWNALVIVDQHCLHGAWNPMTVTPTTMAVGSLALALMVVAFILAGILTQSSWYAKRSERGVARPDLSMLQSALATRSMTYDVADTKPS